MLPYFEVQTIDIGLVNIQVWGLFFSLAIAVATIYLLRKNKLVSAEVIYDFIIWTIVGVIIGGRIGFILTHGNQFGNWISYLTFWDGGLAFYGGFFGGLVSGSCYLWSKKVNYLQFADMVSPAIALSLVVGRIGCYLTGEHLGGPTNFFLGVNKGGITIHQTSVYLILSNSLLFIILLIVERKKVFDGQVALVFLLCYSLFRLLIDGLRTDEPSWWGFTPSQVLSLPIFIISFVLMFKQLSKTKFDKCK